MKLYECILHSYKYVQIGQLFTAEKTLLVTEINHDHACDMLHNQKLFHNQRAHITEETIREEVTKITVYTSWLYCLVATLCV